MKTINYFFALVIALAFVACDSSENEASIDNNTLSFESMKSTYGIESAFLTQSETNNTPSVTLEEIQGVLEALRKNSNISQDCKVVDSESRLGADQDRLKKVQMTSEYQARTRGGALLENFALCVSLNFNIDKAQVYYIGTDYTYSTDLFNWQANGLSLAPIKNSSYYGFDSTSFLYFRVSDHDNCLVKVPVVFNGKYDFKANQGTYRFALSKVAN